MFPLKAVLVGSDAGVADLGNALTGSGVEIETRFPDAASLRRSWAEPPAGPRMFVSVLGSEDDLLQFRQLCEFLPGWPALVGLSGDYDARAVVRVNRAGAAQIVPVPWTEDDLHQALDRVAAQSGYAARPGKLIVVGGVAEGCGAVTLAVNLAAEAAATWHKPTILAEPAHAVGRLADRLDVAPEQTTEQLFAQGSPTRNALRTALAPVGERLRLLAGPRFKLPAKSPDPARVTTVVDLLRRSADVTVLDLPYTYDELYFDLLASADHAVLVAAQQVPDLHALLRVREALLGRPHVCQDHAVVTRYDSARDGFELPRLKQILQTDEVCTVADDANCTVALNAGKPLHETAPRSQSRLDVLALATRLFGPPPEATGQQGSGFFRWLRGG
jgi:Flp pilus assembly CpaE family ATPase